MPEHDRVVVGVNDVHVRGMPPRQLMYIPLRGQSRPDIYKLADTLFLHEELHGALEELAVLQRR